MIRLRAIVTIVAVIAAAVLVWVLIAGSKREPVLSGYIEAENLYLAAPVAGTVQWISAVEGERAQPGQRLFAIDPATLSAQGQQAEASEAAARTQIASARANAQQADADVAAAQATAERARLDLARLMAVRSDDAAAVAGKDIDQARASLREADARVVAARETAKARAAQVDVAQSQATQAAGGKREVAIRVDQLSPVVPAQGRIEDVFFQRGEWVAANQAIVSLIPDNKVKVRFFVPQAQVARYRPGKSVRFSCDGCPAGLSAEIRYVSPRPEFTPPVIFSRDSRDKLVFMVEAYPRNAASLNPGLPVDVIPLP